MDLKVRFMVKDFFPKIIPLKRRIPIIVWCQWCKITFSWAFRWKLILVDTNPFKGVFSDFNNIILLLESEDINQKSLFPKFQLIPILCFQVMYDYVLVTAPQTTVLHKVSSMRLSVNCSHFLPKWLQLNSFGEMCFLEGNYQNMQKKSNFKISEHPLFEIGEYAFNNF